MSFKAVLFDLDGTLLPLDTEEFLKQYLKLLAGKVAHLIEPEVFITKLLSSTEVMVANSCGNKTNEEVFMEDFLPKLGTKQIEIMGLIDDFYRNEFKVIKKVASPIKESREIVKFLINKGIAVVLASNPVFPLVAFEERMKWAGIEDLPFQFVTSFEIMHFCKPNIGYYEEILSKLQLNAEDCLMVGNDAQEDLVAGKLGIKTFLVNDGFIIDRSQGKYQADYTGKLQDIYKVI
ncbi:MAG: HAD family hydrolase [Bacillota bacterium]|nr:HAD family hydrolase [Bacillota bacterium]